MAPSVRSTLLKKASISFETKESLPKVPLDLSLFRQIIHNLAVNAIRYSNDKDGEIKVVLDKVEDNLLITIQDNGIGIPKEIHNKIFNKFFRADNAIKATNEGTGLGLYIAKEIAEASGGRLWFGKAL